MYVEEWKLLSQKYGQYFYKSKEFDAFVTIKTIDTSVRIKDVFNEFEKKRHFKRKLIDNCWF